MKVAKALAELRRGARLTRAGGLGVGLAFAREELARNSWLRLGAALGARGVECNVCGWSGARYLSHCAAGFVDQNAFCPRCKSYPRHRGFVWLWRARLARELGGLRHARGAKLHFAPEAGLHGVLRADLGPLAGVDLDPRRAHVALRQDLQALGLADGSVAFASCFHVLEHVADDRRALAELRRVLAPEGRLVLCVPLARGRAATLEYGAPDPRLDDHWRDYGEDFRERLLEAGLSGVSFRLDEVVPSPLHARLALTPEEVFLLWPAPRGRAASIEAERPAGAPALS